MTMSCCLQGVWRTNCEPSSTHVSETRHGLSSICMQCKVRVWAFRGKWRFESRGCCRIALRRSDAFENSVAEVPPCMGIETPLSKLTALTAALTGSGSRK